MSNSNTKYEFKGTHSLDNAQLRDGYEGERQTPYVDVSVPGRHIDSPIARFYCFEQGKGDGKEWAMLFKAAPALLSALIKAVEDEERMAASYKPQDGYEEYPYPVWYLAAKQAIEQALNIKP